MSSANEIVEAVRDKYGRIARGEQSGCCGPTGVCGGTSETKVALEIGYGQRDLSELPDGTNLGLGCGAPIGFLELKPGEHVVDLGGVRVRIMAMGYNHTRGDTAFFVEGDGVLFSGDVVMTALPNVGGSTVRQWMASMNTFEKLQPRRIVPSHGPMGDASLIATYKTIFQTVQARAVELKKQGRSAEEATAAIAAELQPRYPNGGNRLLSTIRAAYAEAP